MSKARKELKSSLNKLSLSERNKKLSLQKKKEFIVDSWEDDDLSSGEETDHPITAQSSIDYPDAPPPTPISPTTSYGDGRRTEFISPLGETWMVSANSNSMNSRGERTSSARPEKTDAVAKRLIAGALGVRAPKKTEEQRAYDRVIKENEMKKKNSDKEAKIRAEEDTARAKAAAWSD